MTCAILFCDFRIVILFELSILLARRKLITVVDRPVGYWPTSLIKQILVIQNNGRHRPLNQAIC